jgi:hypothetical protein
MVMAMGSSSVVGLCVVAGLAAQGFAQGNVQVLAFSGQALPGQGGATFASFVRAVSDGQGVTMSVALNDTTAGTNNATLLYDEAAGAWQTVMRKGQVSGGSQYWIPQTSMVRAGQVLSYGIVQPFPTPDLITALSQGPAMTPEGWVTIARSRTPTGIGSISFGSLNNGQLNAQREVLVRTSLEEGGPGNLSNAFLLQRGSTRQLLLRSGRNLPNSLIETVGSLQTGAIGDASAGVTPLVFGLSTLLSEGIVLRAAVDGAGSVVWSEQYRAAQSGFGDGSRGGALLSGVSMGFAGAPVAMVVEQKNSAGVQTGEALMRAEDAGAFAPIARTGQPAAGGRTFVTLEQEAPAVFGGSVAFRASARLGAGPAQSAIWWQRARDAAPALVAMVGEPAVVEDLPSGLTWSSVQPPRLGPVVFGSGPGAVALGFGATVSGPGVNASNNVVACLVEPVDPANPTSAVRLRLVAREGQSLLLPSGVATLGEFGVAGRGVTETLNQTGVTERGVLLVGSLTDTRSVLLRVSFPRECATLDFNSDGLFPDDNDLLDFLSVLAGGPCSNDPNCGSIDFNRDGLFPDENDLVLFLCELAGGVGCCV